jgi:hypothetical protein
MPRHNKSRLFPIALSPARAAQALDLRPDQIAAMIRTGLPVHKVGAKRRILVKDIYHFIRRNWPRAS